MSQVDSALDQEVILTDEDTDLLDQVEEIIEGARREDDVQYAFGVGRKLRRTLQVGGVALSKLLYLIRENFYPNDHDSFEDDAFSELGLSYQTIRKYTRVYEHVLIPHPELASKPIGALILLVAAAREGDLTDEDWEEIEMAPDVATIREIVRAARGQTTSSETAITIFIDRDGILKARQGTDGELIEFGSMPPNHPNEVAQKARARMIRAPGVVEL